MYLFRARPEQPVAFEDVGGDGGGGGGGSGGSNYSPSNFVAPAGVPQDIWDSMNWGERTKCISDLGECAIVALIVKDAGTWSTQQTPGLTSNANNERDALRHALWQANLTVVFGPTEAKVWGDLHEQSANSEQEHAMDFHNNEVGRSIGEYWMDNLAGPGNTVSISSMVLIARDNGTLILNLSDSRIPPPSGTAP